MRVVYKKTMMEKLQSAVRHAKDQRKKIHYIELQRDEWDRLNDELDGPAYKFSLASTYRSLHVAVYVGIELRLGAGMTNECHMPEQVEVRCYSA